jgi:hypothetical protein
MTPPKKLIKPVAMSLARARLKPKVAVENKKISGSMDGLASQKAMTGAKGTPEAIRAAITGMMEQEQNGAKAPMAVAINMATNQCLLKIFFIFLSALKCLIMTEIGIVTKRTGHMCKRFSMTKLIILRIGFISAPFIVKIRLNDYFFISGYKA